MSATRDYVQPYGILAQHHKDGLDAIITAIGAGGPGTVTVDDIIDAVFDYIDTTFLGGSANLIDETNLKAGIANAINGYIQHGGSSPYLRALQSIPATALVNGFDRMADALPAAPSLKSGSDRAQMVQSIGQADAEYWANQIATTGSWTPYLNGNAAIDTATLPFWVDAAMFGAQFSYGQLPGTDRDSVSIIIVGVLSGSLAAAAGKVVFGWVAKVPVALPARILGKPTGRPVHSTGRQFAYSCFANGEYSHGRLIDSASPEAAQGTLDSSTAGTGWACYLDVV